MSSTSNQPSATPAQLAQYEKEVRVGCIELRKLATETTGWKQIHVEKGVTVWHQPAVDGKHAVFKGTGVLDVPYYVAMELLMDTQKKSEYDMIFEKAILIQLLTDHIKIERQCYWAPFPVSSRDFIMLCNKAKLEDGTIVLFGKSLTLPSHPPESKYIRGQIHIGGWIIEPILPANPQTGAPVTAVDVSSLTIEQLQESKTRVTFVGATDLKGSMPAFLKFELDKKQPSMINTIKPFLAKKMDALAKMKNAAANKPEERKKYVEEINKLKELVDCLPVYYFKELEELAPVASASPIADATVPASASSSSANSSPVKPNAAAPAEAAPAEAAEPQDAGLLEATATPADFGLDESVLQQAAASFQVDK